MNPFFSVIIPCCDVADYVVECLDSLRRQHASWECLVVIEESKDATESVIRQNVGDDPRFKIFTEPRSGSPATPRNTGLKHASGEYVVFMDGDDTFEDEALVKLQEEIARQPGGDLYSIVMQQGDKMLDQFTWVPSGKSYTGPELLVELARRMPIFTAMAPLQVCRRAFLEENKLRFVDQLRYEDEEFTPRAIYKAKKFVPTHIPFYRYRVRPGQITSTVVYQHWPDFTVVYRRLFQFWGTERPADDVSRALARLLLNKFLYLFFHPRYLKCVTPRRQRALLWSLFLGGTANFRALSQYASLPKRLGAWIVHLSWRLGTMFPARVYFWLYFKLVDMRDRS